MCYPAPGPKCSAHAEAAFNAARDGGDPELIDAAWQEWAATPAGITHLRKQGKYVTEMDEFEADRKRALRAFARTIRSPRMRDSEQGIRENHRTLMLFLPDAGKEPQRSSIITAINGDRDFPTDVLAQLAVTDVPEIRRAVAAHGKVSPETLHVLLTGGAWDAREQEDLQASILRSPAPVIAATLVDVWELPGVAVRVKKNLLAHPRADAAVLARFAASDPALVAQHRVAA